ncbi:MAG: hypothetical protein JWL63_296 [Rhodocyclales bacterium]|nr:hypothetical protein [Rhodocyclales bacterium]
MTDTERQPIKKSARPNLFAPQEQTRIVDERISVLASLDANPPPKKKKKKRGGLAHSTLVMLCVAVFLLGGATYLVLTQESGGNTTETAHSPVAAPQAIPAQPASERVVTSISDTPSLSLSELAASAPTAETSAPGSAVIENVPTVNPGNPVAVLQSGGKAPASAAEGEHGAPSSLLKALTAPATSSKPQKIKPAVQSVPQPAPKSATQVATLPASQGARTTHSSANKSTAVDTDVVLIEALVASSDRQKAREAAEAKSKDHEQEQAKADKPKVNESAAVAQPTPAEKTKP